MNDDVLIPLSYRDGRHEQAKQVSGKSRWMDHGMGGSVAEIADRCQAYRSDHVLLFSVVINPNPDLLHMVPPEQRERFVKQLTERTMNDFFAARGIDTGVEWSAVLHHRQTDGEEAPGQHNPHTHIVLPGTYYDTDEGRRKPLYFSQNRQVNHIELLHSTTQNSMADLMDRYVGPEWKQRYDVLAAVREQQERIAYTEQAHGILHGEPVWCGVRRTDEDTSAAGYYTYLEDREGRTRLQFRPVMAGLAHEEAEVAAEYLKRQLQADTPEIDLSAGRTPTLDL